MFTAHFSKSRLSLLAAFVIAFFVQTGSAQVVVKFDENGTGSVQFPGAVPVPMPTLGNIVDPFDPGSGIKPLAYNYASIIGTAAIQGDVILIDPGNTTPQGNGDIVRFMQGLILVYSDVATAPETPPLADVGIPSLFQQNNLFMNEAGPEAGPNGMFGYVPGTGQPGQLPAAFSSVSYNFISDPQPTPEPGALMALLPLGAMLLIRRRRAIV